VGLGPGQFPVYKKNCLDRVNALAQLKTPLSQPLRKPWRMYEFTAHHGVRGAGGHRVRDKPLVGSTIEKRKEGIDKFGISDIKTSL
jgi:hypothetical protein